MNAADLHSSVHRFLRRRRAEQVSSFWRLTARLTIPAACPIRSAIYGSSDARTTRAGLPTFFPLVRLRIAGFMAYCKSSEYYSPFMDLFPFQVDSTCSDSSDPVYQALERLAPANPSRQRREVHVERGAICLLRVLAFQRQSYTRS